MRLLLHAASVIVTCVCSAPFAAASTYTVDAGGGGQFTDIQSAITAAQTGDVILVSAGTYAGFTLDKGVAIIGYGTVQVNGTAQVTNVAAGTRAAIVRVSPL